MKFKTLLQSNEREKNSHRTLISILLQSYMMEGNLISICRIDLTDLCRIKGWPWVSFSSAAFWCPLWVWGAFSSDFTCDLQVLTRRKTSGSYLKLNESFVNQKRTFHAYTCMIQQEKVSITEINTMDQGLRDTFSELTGLLPRFPPNCNNSKQFCEKMAPIGVIFLLLP